MAKSKPKGKSKKTKKPSKILIEGLTRKTIKTMAEEHRQGERRIIQKLRDDSRIDPKYLRIPFTI